MADIELTINNLNLFLRNMSERIEFDYRQDTYDQMPVVYSWMQRNLTHIGDEVTKVWGEGFEALTHEITRKPELIFGTSIALHFKAVRLGGTFENADYAYKGASFQNVPTVSHDLNETANIKYSPTLTTNSSTRAFTQSNQDMGGEAVDGEYPHYVVHSGAPEGVLNTIEYVEGKKGPYDNFNELGSLSGDLSSAGYEPANGITVTNKEAIVDNISPLSLQS
jgi:hypothetical protein